VLWGELDCVRLRDSTVWGGKTVPNSPAQIFCNGVLEPATTPPGEVTWDQSISLRGSGWFDLGKQVNQNHPLAGPINDVAVFHAGLTSAQVQGIDNAGNSGVCK
jgi:hypothetical protein